MPETNSDTEAIKSILQEQETAWNRGDAEAYARHIAADCTFTNILGMFFTGQQIFRERHDYLLKKVLPGTVLHQEVVSIRFIHTGTAVVETLTIASGCPDRGALPGVHIDAAGQLYTRLLQVMVKDAAGWKIVAYHNVDVKAGVPPR